MILRNLFVICSLCLLVSCSGGGGGSEPSAGVPTQDSNPTNDPTNTPTTGGTNTGGTPVDPAPTNDSPYQTATETQYESALMECVPWTEDGEEPPPSCTFNRLPLLGMENSQPTVDEIMDRVIVSHEWMGVRFREVLENLPPEVRLMTRSLTGIMISHDIRPSFYYAGSGAIYLDPEDLWLTAEEEATIDDAPDYRSAFGSQLEFRMLWRYVNGNTDIRAYTRSLETITLKMGALMLHELAHANDYFEPGIHDSINPFSTVEVIAVTAETIAPGLTATYPLASDMMKSLAQVSFRGQDATAAQRALTPADIGAEFGADFANDYYNYYRYASNYEFREDVAMAFEEAMMYYSFGLARDVAVTNYPDSNFCDDYVVAWGTRYRIGDPAVKARAQYVIDRILPEYASRIEDALASVPAPIPMTPGLDWCENISLVNESRAASRRADAEPMTVESLVPYL